MGNDRIIFDASQESFDDEIRAARAGGLKYWAYLTYGSNGAIDLDNSMMKGLAYHLNSSIANEIQFCLVLTLDTIGQISDHVNAFDRIIYLVNKSNYLKVMNGRPVFYLYYRQDVMDRRWKGSLDYIAERLKLLRQSLNKIGHLDPYLIIMCAPPSLAETVRFKTGADAISAYGITLGPNANASYAQYASFVRAYWERELRAGQAGVVPTVMIGWDSRPRREIPPSYDLRDYSKIDKAAHIESPTPDEFAAECQAAMDFVNKYPQRCEARLVLIYAWNENSEGGALGPTIGDPSASKLRAARKILN
ncbi:glycoside hydrolase family 99-like domain-containing protein [Methylobacterium komagatae]|uniref:Glycoside hydrolase family 99-like domain-containing protein n=1 Tax=Methylobacterium komagatae TaxID=374425 RepID=A0ABW2BM11_9HYPH